MRKSGILLPVASLPSKYGIGCFSKEAYQFVDFLKRAGQKQWQILPLGPTGYGDSPYQSFSTFAGNPYFIDLTELIKEGLLTKEECNKADFGTDASKVDYEKIYLARYDVLRLAFGRADLKKNKSYLHFVKKNQFWLEDYALYTAIKEEQDGISWMEWPKPIRNRQPQAMMKYRQRLDKEMQFVYFLQYYFAKQWKALKKYANKKGIEIIGDIPIYVAMDSADTWANPEMFQFDEDLNPVAVAGCPPDAFCATGQLWGNPLYRWDYMKETGYEWWIMRIRESFKRYDVVRVDHFRGFDEYYSIPFGDPTAEFGHWEAGPGLALFEKVKEQLGEVKIIAEDLGFLTESVIKLVKDSGYPGMKVLQFAFDARESSDYLPHNYEHNCVVYTGTHDNDTTLHWYETLNKQDRAFAKRYIGFKGNINKKINWELIRLAMASVADTCVIPMQDYLSIGGEGRINMPSTLGDNWQWRMKKGAANLKLARRIRKMTKLYGR